MQEENKLFLLDTLAVSFYKTFGENIWISKYLIQLYNIVLGPYDVILCSASSVYGRIIPYPFSIHNFSSPNFKFILLQYCFFFPKVIEYKCMLRNINSFSRPYDIFKSYSSYALCQKIFLYPFKNIISSFKGFLSSLLSKWIYPGKHSSSKRRRLLKNPTFDKKNIQLL